MNPRLDKFLQSIASPRADSDERPDRCSDGGVTVSPSNVTVSGAAVTDGLPAAGHLLPAYSEAQVAQVAVFSLPSSIGENKKPEPLAENLFSDSKESREISATSATSATGIPAVVDSHVEPSIAVIGDQVTGNAPSQSAPEGCVVPAATPLTPLPAPFTHLTVSGTSLHDLELGHMVVLPAALPVFFFRALFEARSAGVLASCSQKCQQQIWHATSAGYLVAWIQNRFYRVSAFSLTSQFVPVINNTKGQQSCQ
jgi:hypothetical protein